MREDEGNSKSGGNIFICTEQYSTLSIVYDGANSFVLTAIVLEWTYQSRALTSACHFLDVEHRAPEGVSSPKRGCNETGVVKLLKTPASRCLQSLVCLSGTRVHALQ